MRGSNHTVTQCRPLQEPVVPPGQVGLQEGEQGQEDEDTQANGENLAGQVLEEGDCRCTSSS